jgi:hypothetical protein
VGRRWSKGDFLLSKITVQALFKNSQQDKMRLRFFINFIFQIEKCITNRPKKCNAPLPIFVLKSPKNVSQNPFSG